jgi:pyruvate,water dikinase
VVSVAEAADWPDPLHNHTDSAAFWTTVNVAEAIPGVPTPMNWSLFGYGGNHSVPRAYYELGILPRAQPRLSPDVADHLSGIFYGRAALNVSRLREIADLTPGTSGEAMERQLLGSARDGVPSQQSLRRLPFVAVRFPWQAIRLPALLRGLHDDQLRWWSESALRPSAEPSIDLLAAAVRRFDRAMTVHLMGIAVSQACFEQVTRLAQAAGDPALVPRLTSAYGGYEEVGMIAALWEVAHGRCSTESFVARYGFHGPDEGEISSPSWREDPSLVTMLAKRYHERGREETERERDARRAERQTAERELSAALAPAQRAKARVVLKLAERYLPLREVGKAAFLMAVDVARYAARRHGDELVESSVLAQTDDVFYFTFQEVLGGLPPIADQVAAARQVKRREYQSLTLPDRWSGMPVPSAISAETHRAVPGEVLTGVSVTNGVVRGVVRVATTLGAAEMVEPDEILVCEVTDPSWCTVFPLLSGLIVDVGGPLSHAAIVAREMAVPCVINTREAVRRLETGMLVQLDAGKGTVEVLDSGAGGILDGP